MERPGIMADCFTVVLFVTGDIAKQDPQIIPAPVEDTVHKYISAADAIEDDIISSAEKMVVALNVGDRSEGRASQRIVAEDADGIRDPFDR